MTVRELIDYLESGVKVHPEMCDMEILVSAESTAILEGEHISEYNGRVYIDVG